MKKILLVEDAPQVAGILISKLEREGHSVKWVRNRIEALNTLTESAFDLIKLSTYLLPLRDAWILLGELKDQPTPVVFLLETEEIHLKERALSSGAGSVIQKPFKPTAPASKNNW